MSATLLTELALQSDAGLPAFFLGRLDALVARQAAAPAPRERAALAVATFSVYLDCLDLGLGAEARAIMARLDDRAGERVAA